MGKNSGSGRVLLGVRLPQDLIDRLKASAEVNGRTIQAEMEMALERSLGDQDGDAVLSDEVERAIETKVRKYLDRLAAGRG